MPDMDGPEWSRSMPARPQYKRQMASVSRSERPPMRARDSIGLQLPKSHMPRQPSDLSPSSSIHPHFIHRVSYGLTEIVTEVINPGNPSEAKPNAPAVVFSVTPPPLLDVDGGTTPDTAQLALAVCPSRAHTKSRLLSRGLIQSSSLSRDLAGETAARNPNSGLPGWTQDRQISLAATFTMPGQCCIHQGNRGSSWKQVYAPPSCRLPQNRREHAYIS